MARYNFDVLDDYEFETLCRDLLNEEQMIDIKTNHGLRTKDEGNYILNFTSFKKGKDGGVDLYFDNENITVIGQVKQASNGFNALMGSLRQKKNGKNEVDKVRELNPSKYIFMTSAPLSLKNKKALQEFFAPFIIKDSDIYGKEDLERLLGRFQNIERMYVKLYFDNPAVLQRLLTVGTLSGSDFTLRAIQGKLDNFVQTDNFTKALSIIDRTNTLIIRGLPGVGKSTLADILSLYYVEAGYKFIEILGIDNEIEQLLNEDEKYIFYYDDFLGANTLILGDTLRNEGKLTRLLRRISQSRTKKIVLTSRNNIINKAKLNSENLERFFGAVDSFEVDITQLSNRERSQILEKHISLNGVPNAILTQALKNIIIEHRNFSPRLIAFITANYKDYFEHSSFETFAISTLNNPEEVWKFGYSKHIGHAARIYLNHLFLFGKACEANTFRESYNLRIRYESVKNSYLLTYDEFRDSTKEMDNTFIKISLDSDYGGLNQNIDFINPSFVDFLIAEIKANRSMIVDSVRSFDKPEIIMARFDHRKKELLNIITIEELRKLLLNSQAIKIFKQEDSIMTFMELLSNYFSINEIEAAFPDEVQIALETEEVGDSIQDYYNFLMKFNHSLIIKNYVKLRYNSLFSLLLPKIYYKNDFDAALEISDIYNLGNLRQKLNFENKKLLSVAFRKMLTEAIEELLYIRQNQISSQKQVEDFYNEVKATYASYFRKLNYNEDIAIQILDNINWDDIIKFQKFQNSGI